MQEEVTQKTIALSMKTGKLTAQALQAALKKYLQHLKKADGASSLESEPQSTATNGLPARLLLSCNR